ncbi:TRAP transporter large permease subunit [Suttonella sp. R2A3]|uniref:TRAP transporter large permease n=1 Tax=Suttonella sp. R2A3 TaxID=2908648 RepID=UPI001F2769D6|nr:TRAP transporter large permease subunit [Suttonella sp. R2A3]UJF24123.1 TRAP transporter large permease subunit [Suttonella sp. R2A3]
MPLIMFVALCVVLMLGYPVALSLAGVALAFAGGGMFFEVFDPAFLHASGKRLYGIMTNTTLIAVPTFIFMGLTLQKAKIAEDLLETMSLLFGGVRGGLAFSVAVVGMLLAASTGIVGATVVTMGLLSLPVMLKRGYDPALATGIICASGTLGQIIPPSIVLILLGDVVGNAYSEAQLAMGNWSPETVSISDLFAAAVVPGVLLVGLYIVYLLIRAWLTPDAMPLRTKSERIEARGERFYLRLLFVLLPPLLLIGAVLGSIFLGVATPTDAASVGAFGAAIIALVRYGIDKYHGKETSLRWLIDVPRETLSITAMVFFILIGASLFSLVFRGYGGDHLIEQLLTDIPGGVFGAMLLIMVVMFLLGFVLDFIEIIFVIVPIVAPVLFKMGVDPTWFAIMIALNLQTSFLTPPFGFALFFLRGVAPESVPTAAIYKGVLPFIVIQILLIVLIALVPDIVHWISLG